MEIPTYHRAPNFSIPPNGHVQLGTIITDLGQLEAINEGDVVPIPVDRTHKNKSKGFQATITNDRSLEVGFWAKVFTPAAFGAEVSDGHQKNVKTTVYVRDLETTYFFPSIEYMSTALQRPALKTFMEVSHKRIPVYMITGIKIARGATWESSNTKTNNAALNVSLPDPLAGMVEVGPKLNSSTAKSSSTQVEDSEDFILAYRATKIWYSMRGHMKTEHHLKGATMADDSAPAKTDALEDIEFIHDIAEGGEPAKILQVLKEEEEQDGEPAVWVLHEDA
ncbi:hypothetical protein E8E14_013084 [Neopestalotiopsis sp. 37M]|nr:hypothetical protein E8E14_013084 [Neopestalotiopsis sp. 37M]